MAKKVYKNDYMIIIEDTVSSYESFNIAKNCEFGFDSSSGEDFCWMQDTVEGVMILRCPIADMLDGTDSTLADISAVETYLFKMCGDTSGDDVLS